MALSLGRARVCSTTAYCCGLLRLALQAPGLCYALLGQATELLTAQYEAVVRPLGLLAEYADSAASNAQAITELPMAAIQQMTNLTTLWCAPRVHFQTGPKRRSALGPISCLQTHATARVPVLRPVPLCCALHLAALCVSGLKPYACPGSTATRAAAHLTWSGTRRGCWLQDARWLAA